MTTVDISKLQPISSMSGEDDTETEELTNLLRESEAFLKSFKWYGQIKSAHFGLGVSKIVGVFLYEIVPQREDIDNTLWVIVGEIPPAYLVTDDAPNAARALGVYIREMRKWVSAVKFGQKVSDLIPVNAPPTLANATDLENRLNFIEKNILSMYEDEL
jgi:hypothetical protein